MRHVIFVSGGGIITLINDDSVVFDQIGDATILSKFQSLGDILSEMNLSSREEKKAFQKYSERIINETISKLASDYEIDADKVLLIYFEGAGGFCGSTGKSPIPLPVKKGWLERIKPDIYTGLSRDILKQYNIDQETANFLKESIDQKVDMRQLFLEPQRTAEELKIDVTSNILSRLNFIKENHEKFDKVDEEVIEFVNRVIVDGRFVGKWVIKPQEVARELGLDISESALERIKNSENLNLTGIFERAASDTMASATIVAIVITIGITMYSSYQYNQPRIFDESGIHKF